MVPRYNIVVRRCGVLTGCDTERGDDNIVLKLDAEVQTVGSGRGDAQPRSRSIDVRVRSSVAAWGRILCTVNEVGNRPRFATVIINGPKVCEPKPTTDLDRICHQASVSLGEQDTRFFPLDFISDPWEPSDREKSVL